MMNDFYYHYQLNSVEWEYLFFPIYWKKEFQNSSRPTEEWVSTIARQERTYRIQKQTINNMKDKSIIN